ncbi:type 2 lanthipeptide synthetase LanM [Streptomyces collinus]|uniref:type 2 lanthipeptide synthetase LanM n=1 Tax=Streptomyces collinus TaxID=42684 RepID=UPI002942AE8C|nr:type 2 lanthipeptide synthetase LanM [Streptomyces collinus]
MTYQALSDTRWWAALTAAERAAGLNGAKKLPDAGDGSGARARLARWLDGHDSTVGSPLVERWRTELGLTSAEWTLMLGEQPVQIRQRDPQALPWLLVLDTAWREWQGHEFPDWDCAPADRAILDWIGPLAHWAQQELRRNLAASGDDGLVLSPDHPATRPDTARLLLMLRKVWAAEFAQHYRGDSPEQEAAASFARRLRDRETGVQTLARYPVLARALVRHFRSWTRVRTEFITRLAHDLPTLCRVLPLDVRDLTDVSAIDFGAGDTHNGGQTVALITFSHGQRLVYKPRGLAVEAHVDDFVRWLSGLGTRYPLHPGRILDRGPYGWCEYVSHEPCPTREGAARFYWRHGFYLAVLYLLRGYDLHDDNVIAVGEHPRFIDLEAAFHAPRASLPEEDTDPVSRDLRASVLMPGLLPQRVVTVGPSSGRSASWDASGMGGGLVPDDDDTSPSERPSHNLAVLDGRPVDPRHHVPSLLEGFTECYRMLLEQRDILLADDGPLSSFATDTVRHVLRDTAFYKRLDAQSWEPSLLRDALDREYSLRHGLAAPDGTEPTPEQVDSERRQLEEADVPAFYAAVDSTALEDGQGVIAADFLQCTGLQAVRKRLLSMSEEDLDKQTWIVRASVATLARGWAAPTAHFRNTAELRQSLDSGEAAVAAQRVADRLIADVVRCEQTDVIEWRTLACVDNRNWVIKDSGFSLHEGITGVALFLAELDRTVGHFRARRLAQDVIAALIDPTELPDLDQLRGVPAGGHQELGGLVYTLARLGVLWADSDLFSVAHHLAGAVGQNLSDSGDASLHSGLAGGVLAIRALQRVDPRAATQQILDRLTSLLTAASAHSAPTRAAAVNENGRATYGPFLDLLHGGSGVGYALGDTVADRSSALCFALEQACGTSSWSEDRFPLFDNDSLARGALGISDLLLSIDALSHEPEARELALGIAREVAGRVIDGKFCTAVPGAVWHPGLFAGTAGLGYGLLRAASPTAMPSTVLLE